MELFSILYLIIFGIICLIYSAATNKEAQKFISDPYAYHSKKHGDGYLMYNLCMLGWIFGTMSLIGGICLCIAVYF